MLLDDEVSWTVAPALEVIGVNKLHPLGPKVSALRRIT